MHFIQRESYSYWGHNKALHWIFTPLRSIVASELGRYVNERKDDMNSRQLAKRWPFPRHKLFEKELRNAATRWFQDRGYPTHSQMSYCLRHWTDWKNNIILPEVSEYNEKTKNECEGLGGLTGGFTLGYLNTGDIGEGLQSGVQGLGWGTVLGGVGYVTAGAMGLTNPGVFNETSKAVMQAETEAIVGFAVTLATNASQGRGPGSGGRGKGEGNNGSGKGGGSGNGNGNGDPGSYPPGKTTGPKNITTPDSESEPVDAPKTTESESYTEFG